MEPTVSATSATLDVLRQGTVPESRKGSMLDGIEPLLN